MRRPYGPLSDIGSYLRDYFCLSLILKDCHGYYFVRNHQIHSPVGIICLKWHHFFPFFLTLITTKLLPLLFFGTYVHYILLKVYNVKHLIMKKRILYPGPEPQGALTRFNPWPLRVWGYAAVTKTHMYNRNERGWWCAAASIGPVGTEQSCSRAPIMCFICWYIAAQQNQDHRLMQLGKQPPILVHYESSSARLWWDCALINLRRINQIGTQ